MKPSLTLLAAGLAAALLLPAGAFAAPPQHVEESLSLAASPARVWAVVGSFSGLPGWHPAVATTTITAGKDNRRGAVRSIETRDGAVLVEELLARDAGKRTLRYRIIDSPLPVRGYVSTLSVEPAGQGSRVVWKSDFTAVTSDTVDAAKAREIVAGIYTAGFEGLRKTLGEKR